MSVVVNSLNLAKKQPFGCFVSLVISVALIGVSLAAMAFTIYGLIAVGLIKNATQNASGFYLTSDSTFVNLFTGKCVIYNMQLDNPSVYASREYFEKSADPAKPFMKAKKVELQISPINLLFSELVISSMDLQIDELNCVRLNNSTYNLSEFLLNAKKFVKFNRDDGIEKLSEINVRINKVSYRDLSSISDIIKYDSSENFKFSEQNVSDFSKLLSELETALDSNKMRFISKGLSVLKAN